MPTPQQRELPAPTKLLVDRLSREGVDFELLPHGRSTTAAAEARALGVLAQTVAKTVIAKGADEVYVRAIIRDEPRRAPRARKGGCPCRPCAC